MLWQSHAMREQSEELARQHVQITEHIGKVILYDEVLTMSARQCAATSDFSYEQRYNDFDHELTVQLDALRSFIPASEIADLVTHTDAANERLIAMERDAFLKTHAGQGAEALGLLTSAEYNRLKAEYAAGMRETTDAASRAIAREYERVAQRTSWFTAGSAPGIVGLLIAWFAAVRSANAWVVLRAHAEMARMRHLEEVSREKDEFLATINHSLRTPLHHILGFGELLKAGRVGALTPKQQEFVGDMCAAATAQLSLVNSLIELAEAQTLAPKLDLQSVSPRRVLESLTEEHRSLAQQAGVTIKIQTDSTDAPIALDQTIVRRVLEIYLRNACQFTPDGGCVTLAARRTTRSNPTTATDAVCTDFVEFKVTDTGAGITPAVLARLFRPFIQGDGRLARSHQGTGIALTLARKLAERHRGDCTVASTLGVGSTFSLWIPIQLPLEQAP